MASGSTSGMKENPSTNATPGFVDKIQEPGQNTAGYNVPPDWKSQLDCGRAVAADPVKADDTNRPKQ